MKPLVSILCITYNQEKYIAQTIDGFLAQKVDFPIEIVIHDDASTDKTKQIIEKYSVKHPKIFKTIYEKQNQHSQGLSGVFLENMYKSARGKYIAWCEGDDYWTNPQKLQLQADFLEKNPDHVICFHPVNVVFDNGEKKDQIYPIPEKNQTFDLAELLKNNFIQTNSVMYRRQKYDRVPTGIMPIDWYMHIYHTQFGKIGFIDRVMSVYRKHPGGMWWESRQDPAKLWEKYGNSNLQFFVEVLELYGDDQRNRVIIEKTLAKVISDFIESDKKGDHTLLKNVMKKFPQFIEPLIMYEHNQLIEQKKIIEEKQEAIERRNEELQKIKAKNPRSFRAKVTKRFIS